MQQFNNKKGNRRLINIVNMKEEDVDDLYIQISGTDTNNKEANDLKQKIREISKTPETYRWVLSIKDKERKLIGMIEVLQLQPGVGFFTIQIPNEIYRYKYGVKSIKQFLKICTEEAYFTNIELETRNSIVEDFKHSYGLETYIISTVA